MMEKLKEILKGGVFADGDWIESKDQDPSGGIRLIQLADIGDSEFIDKSSRFINLETAKRLNCTFLKKGDVLVARMPDPLGRACIFPLNGDQKYVTAVDVCIIRVNENCDNKYLQYSLNSPSIRQDIERQSTGTTRKRITRKRLGELKIPLPPLATQQKIAAILDEADKVRQLNKQLIEKYDALTQSLFLDMFGENSSERRRWTEKTIKELVVQKKGSMRTGPFGSDLLHSEFVESGIPVLGIDNAVQNKFAWKERRFITEEKYKKLERYTVYPNDVIITIMGTVGRVAVVPSNIGRAINTKHLAAITFDSKIANPHFMAFSLHSDPFILWQINANGRGAIMTGLNLTIIKSIKLKLPPLETQNQFAERVQAIEQQKSQAQSSLQKSEALFQSLLQRAFKGEIA